MTAPLPDAAPVIAALRARGWRVTTAESCTGGLLAGALTEVPGASNVFSRGVITYANADKSALLGVSEDSLGRFGAVSEPVAAEMARGALTRAAADIALSVTGIAGPGGSEFKPEGRVCFGLATASGTQTETVEFGALGRSQVRRAAVAHALDMIGRAAAGA